MSNINLAEAIKQAGEKKVAVGHFNISNSEVLQGVFKAAESLDLPVIIGVSEGEREFLGVKQTKALVDSFKEEFNYPIFLNADHTYTFAKAQEVIDAGFEAITIDGSKLSFEENVAFTKKCVEYARSNNPGMLVEGEIGYIGTSSKVLDEIPEDVIEAGKHLTTPQEAKKFVDETGVDLLSPAVGNLHGMLKGRSNPKIDTERIKEIREAAGVPLILHGGSGITDSDFIEAIKSGISVIHINTEIRVAFRDALKLALQENPDEIAPYRFLRPSVEAVSEVVASRLKLFNQLN